MKYEKPYPDREASSPPQASSLVSEVFFAQAKGFCTFPVPKQVVLTKILQIKQKCAVFVTKQGKCSVATSKLQNLESSI